MGNASNILGECKREYPRQGIFMNKEAKARIKINKLPEESGRKFFDEAERAIVHVNHELIRLYEEKVKKVIEKMWEG